MGWKQWGKGLQCSNRGVAKKWLWRRHEGQRQVCHVVTSKLQTSWQKFLSSIGLKLSWQFNTKRVLTRLLKGGLKIIPSSCMKRFFGQTRNLSFYFSKELRQWKLTILFEYIRMSMYTHNFHLKNLKVQNTVVCMCNHQKERKRGKLSFVILLTFSVSSYLKVYLMVVSEYSKFASLSMSRALNYNLSVWTLCDWHTCTRGGVLLVLIHAEAK